jgi:hypothetical protein
MRDAPPFVPHDGFGFRDGFYAGHLHHDGPPALAWATFALLLLLVLSFAALVLWQLSARRAVAGPGGRRRFAFAGGPGPRRRRPDPVELLRMRYASGEINRDEFLERTADLGGPPSAAEEEPPPSER